MASIHGDARRHAARTTMPVLFVTGALLVTAPAQGGERAPPTGLARPRLLSFCIRRANRVFEHWREQTPEHRAQGLIDAANRCLEILGVPLVTTEFADLGRGTRGLFVPNRWRIRLTRSAFVASSLSEEQRVERLKLVLHEARHPEQQFRVARLLAGRGLTAQQVVDTLGISQLVAEMAIQQPLRGRRPSVKEADRWCRALCRNGSDFAARRAVHETLAAATYALTHAEQLTLWSHASPQATDAQRVQALRLLSDAEAAYRQAFADYRQLIDEIDAFQINLTIPFLCQAMHHRRRSR